jgi:hypothetical protein
VREVLVQDVEPGLTSALICTQENAALGEQRARALAEAEAAELARRQAREQADIARAIAEQQEQALAARVAIARAQAEVEEGRLVALRREVTDLQAHEAAVQARLAHARSVLDAAPKEAA